MKLPRYPSYKPSGAKWLGDVPEHWRVKAIKWESPVLRGASPRPIDNDIYFDDEGEHAWVRIADVTSAGMYLHETTQRLSELGRSLSVPLQPGALLLSIAGSVGKACIAAIKCCIHDGFVHFPFWNGDARFLYYLFASGEPYKGLGKLGTQLNLNTDTVGSIVAGFPTLQEQRAIADFLDAQTSKLDTLVVKKRELIEKLKEKRAALISRTVTRGLPPEAARAAGLNPHPKLKPSGIEWLGDVPAQWRRTRIKFEAVVVSKGTTPFTVSKELVNEGIRFLKAENIYDGKVLSNPEFYIDSETDQLLARSRLKQDDVLIVIAGATTGKAAILPRSLLPANTNQAVCFIRLSNTNYASILLAWISTKFIQDIIWNSAVQAAQPNLAMEDVKAFPCFVPPSQEQRVVAAYLDRETAKIDRMVAKIEAAIEKLQEYRTALITAAVTGKIDVRTQPIENRSSEALSAANHLA
ncbi:MAG: restriction endonuclease subunit S [Burkholderiales bacterium]|nr:restriction endonuclease subunit S [Burkholderiales bacterium]